MLPCLMLIQLEVCKFYQKFSESGHVHVGGRLLENVSEEIYFHHSLSKNPLKLLQVLKVNT